MKVSFQFMSELGWVMQGLNRSLGEGRGTGWRRGSNHSWFWL